MIQEYYLAKTTYLDYMGLTICGVFKPARIGGYNRSYPPL